jgi:hypothetical protein
VLLALATFADKAGRARPSLATLADACTYTPRATNDALKRLCAVGLVKSDGEYGANGVTVWVLVLGLSRNEVDEAVLDGRRDRARVAHVERQRRYRDKRRVTPSDSVTRDATGERHVTPLESVTDESVTPSHDARDAMGQRHVTLWDDARDASMSVTSPGPGLRSTNEVPTEVPGRTTTSPAAKREREIKPLAPRPDVDELCQRLAGWLVRNGCKTPTVGKAWHDAARLLLDEDHRELAKALALVDWCQQDAFWRTNIQSMAKFRKQYDQLRLRANAEWEQRSSQHGYKPFQNPTDDPADYEKGWTS